MAKHKPKIHLDEVCAELGPMFFKRAAEFDASDTFAQQNFEDLKARKVLSAMIPAAYGGGDCSYAQMCRFLSTLAQSCPSTALALSMHQHVVATSIVNARLGRPGEMVLKKVAQSEAMITTTVAKDWIGSSGATTPVEDGFKVNAYKRFVSGAKAGNILMTSAQITGSSGETDVLHFALPYDTKGLTITGEWKAHGMRASGTVDVELKDVFVPHSAVTLRRPSKGLHPIFHVILTVAPTLIMACYLGIAERARVLALDAAPRKPVDVLRLSEIGKLEGLITTARLAHQDMVEKVSDLKFTPSVEGANEILIRKSIVSETVIAVCEQCANLIGSASFLRSAEIERLMRDARASRLHPMPLDQQRVFTGDHLHIAT